MSLKDLIDKYPLVAIEIAAIDRRNSIAKLKLVAEELHLKAYFWSAMDEGFIPHSESLDGESDDLDREKLRIDLGRSIVNSLARLPTNSPGLYVFDNLFATLAALEPIERELGYQAISRCFSALNVPDRIASAMQNRQCSIVFLESSGGEIPASLRQLIWDYQFPLPTPAELKALLLESGIDLSQSPRLANVLAGLTAAEITIGMRANRDVTDPDIFADRLLAYKYSVLAAYGLEFVGTTTTQDIGGLDRVKTALEGVKLDFAPEARELGIPIPRGWLLVGIPGTGKTYFAKICAQKLGFTLINIGIDVAKSGGIKNFKKLLDRLDRIDNCIPYFDEFDKFFVGENSGEFLGVILTWLNEKTSKSFVLATLNRLENLPPEVTRAGRFDRVFYVGFPDAKERQQILQLHCARFDSRFIPTPDRPYGALSREDWVAIIEATHKYVGAELAQIAVEAAKAKYYQSVANYRQLTPPKSDLNSYLQAHPIPIDLPSLLHGKSLVRSLYDRHPEGVFAIENKAAAFAEPASTPQASPFTLEELDIYAVAKL
jgi:hypothetical protein